MNGSKALLLILFDIISFSSIITSMSEEQITSTNIYPSLSVCNLSALDCLSQIALELTLSPIDPQWDKENLKKERITKIVKNQLDYLSCCSSPDDYEDYVKKSSIEDLKESLNTIQNLTLDSDYLPYYNFLKKAFLNETLRINIKKDNI